MIKKIITKTAFLGLIAICCGIQNVKAQGEASEHELQIVSFTEADKSDFDVTTPSNFAGNLKTTALVKVFMPGEIETTDPVASKSIERKPTPGGAYAFYVWIEQHSNSMRIVPKGNAYQSVKVSFKDYGIPLYSPRNKNGGLQAGKVYHLVLRDPAPVYVDTHLQGAYAIVDNSGSKIEADSNGRIALRDLTSGSHIVYIFASDGTSRGTVNINDEEKLYSLDARKKTRIKIETNPLHGKITIINGELEEAYDQTKEYAYGSYKVIALIDGNRVEKTITVDDRHSSFIINNTKTYNITPMYEGKSTQASVYEDAVKLEENEEEGVHIDGDTYIVTRPIGKKYTYYASNYNGKSRKTNVLVTNTSATDYQLQIAARNAIVWPWQREYDAAPIGVSIGYVQKQMVTKGEGEKLKENGVWGDGVDKWLSGMQFGIIAQPTLSWGLGLYTGLSYELYISSNDDVSFQEHNVVVPVQALFRLPFSRKVALSVHGGLGISYAVYGAYKEDDYEDYTDFYGEDAYPQRFNLSLDGGLDFRVGPVQVGLMYSKGLNNHGSYSWLGDYKTTYNKFMFTVAWVLGDNY